MESLVCDTRYCDASLNFDLRGGQEFSSNQRRILYYGDLFVKIFRSWGDHRFCLVLFELERIDCLCSEQTPCKGARFDSWMEVYSLIIDATLNTTEQVSDVNKKNEKPSMVKISCLQWLPWVSIIMLNRWKSIWPNTERYVFNFESFTLYWFFM